MAFKVSIVSNFTHKLIHAILSNRLEGTLVVDVLQPPYAEWSPTRQNENLDFRITRGCFPLSSDPSAIFISSHDIVGVPQILEDWDWTHSQCPLVSIRFYRQWQSLTPTLQSR